MRSPSPADTERQFQAGRGQISNLDRCNQCGATRSAHGPDWTCPAKPARAVAAIMLTAGILLTLTGLILQVTASANQTAGQASATLSAILAGVTLIVAGTVMARRQGN